MKTMHSKLKRKKKWLKSSAITWSISSSKCKCDERERGRERV